MIIGRHYCRGFCEDIGLKKPYYRNSPYNSGYRYCSKCDRWFKTENKFCHCCGNNLRYRPINKTRNEYYQVKRYGIAFIPTAIMICSNLYNVISL